MQMLGYVEAETDNTLQYMTDNRESDEGKPTNELLLTLQMSNEIDFNQLDSVKLDRLYALFQLIQKNNKKITELEIKDHNGKSLGGPFKNVQNMITKEELYNKKFKIYLNNKNGTRYTAWLSSEEIKKAINIEDLVKERYPAN
ncbi:hypothetical protein bcere0007_52660 [Bacillus mycoides]|nr:hypothetical protein bcere0007_52660 [Bacillus mycoides]